MSVPVSAGRKIEPLVKLSKLRSDREFGMLRLVHLVGS
jgi:hypothetical protein